MLPTLNCRLLDSQGYCAIKLKDWLVSSPFDFPET